MFFWILYSFTHCNSAGNISVHYVFLHLDKKNKKTTQIYTVRLFLPLYTSTMDLK